jgi:hypothetical protein
MCFLGRDDLRAPLSARAQHSPHILYFSRSLRHGTHVHEFMHSSPEDLLQALSDLERRDSLGHYREYLASEGESLCITLPAPRMQPPRMNVRPQPTRNTGQRSPVLPLILVHQRPLNVLMLVMMGACHCSVRSCSTWRSAAFRLPLLLRECEAAVLAARAALVPRPICGHAALAALNGGTRGPRSLGRAAAGKDPALRGLRAVLATNVACNHGLHKWRVTTVYINA